MQKSSVGFKTAGNYMKKWICIVMLVGWAGHKGMAQTHKRNVEMMPLNKDSLLGIINNPRNDSGKVNAYHMLGAMAAGTDAMLGVQYSKKGIALAKQLNYQGGMASCMFQTAYCYGLMNNFSKAVPYIDSAIVWYIKLGKTRPLPLCYRTRAEYQQKLGRLKQALIDCDTAMYYSEKTNSKTTVRYLYKILAAIYYTQGDYDQSKTYYEMAYASHAIIFDSIPMADILNKLGTIYERKKEYDRGINSFERAIQISVAIREENNLSEYYSNLSNIWLKKGDKQQAEKNALKAVEAAKAKKDKIQLAAAQSMLSAVYLKTDSTAAAIKSATESFSLASAAAATETSLSSAGILAEGYFKAGDYKNAYAYLKVSKVLTDSLVKIKFDEELASMQTRFKVNEKDKEILLLNKDRELQEQQLKQQRFLMGAATAIAILLLAGIGLFINRNRLRQRMKELELRNQIAADLHDEVGSSLSSIHLLSQMATQQGSEAAHKDILMRMSNNAKETVDKMGDIVWMIKPGETETASLQQRIERFAYEICSSKNIEATIQLGGLEKVKLTMEQRKNIYLILKEAINNAVKYSGSGKLEVKASAAHKELVLQVKDFGKGFDMGTLKKGNGLDNMQRRAGELKGSVQVHSQAGTGTEVVLKMPFIASV
jgi:two-component system, NarL family, sensor histidine kinase UhpB